MEAGMVEVGKGQTVGEAKGRAVEAKGTAGEAKVEVGKGQTAGEAKGAAVEAKAVVGKGQTAGEAMLIMDLAEAEAEVVDGDLAAKGVPELMDLMEIEGVPGSGQDSGAGQLPPPPGSGQDSGSGQPPPPPGSGHGHLPPQVPSSDVSHPLTGSSKFDWELAAFLFHQQKWDDLKTYLAGFLQKNPHDGVDHPHPALMFIVYEQEAIQLMRLEKYDEALALFRDKIEPLLGLDDKMFTPLDLSEHVAGLKKLLDARARPKDDVNPSYSDEPLTALIDYIALYFPRCIRLPSEKWEKTLQEFITAYVDGSGTHFRCLACQWVVPNSQSLASMTAHIKHVGGKQHHKQCRSLTLYLLSRLNILDGKEVTDLDFDSFCSLYKPWTRKRKGASSDLSAGYSPLKTLVVRQSTVPWAGDSLASIVKELAHYNISIVEHFKPHDTSTLATTVRNVSLSHNKIINGMEVKLITGESMDVDNIFALSVSLHTNSALMHPLLKDLPPEVQSNLRAFDTCVSKLRLISYAKPIPSASLSSAPNTSAEASNF